MFVRILWKYIVIILWVKSITQEDISSTVGPCDSGYLKSNEGIKQWICGSKKVEHERSMETNVKIKPR